jgi:hypothetical protein
MGTVGPDDPTHLPHGHVTAVLGTLRKLRRDNLIAPGAAPEREAVMARNVARCATRSKLATARHLHFAILFSTLDEL